MLRRALTSALTSALPALVALASVLVALPAQAAGGSDRWSVPTAATVTITGHGFGHGHGLSQYGAQGAARQGLTYRQIADFYYPGTEWGTARGAISVQITADSTPADLVVLARRGLTLRDSAAPGRTLLPDNGATRWRVVRDGQGRSTVSYLVGRRWTTYAVLGGTGELSAGGAPVTLVTPSGNRAYRGRLRTAVTSAGTLATVNVLSLESYLRGVVPLEMPALWQPEAVRAQAVAARTYAAYGQAHPRSSAYQICDTTSCQVYGGVAAEHPATDAAVRATRGQVLTDGGAPAFAQFSASSGGWTSAGSATYLTAREDPYDDWAGNPVHTWTTTVSDTVLESAWPRIGDLTGIQVDRRDGNGDWGGRVARATLVGTAGRVSVTGDDLRSRLGLRSTWMTFRVTRRG